MRKFPATLAARAAFRRASGPGNACWSGRASLLAAATGHAAGGLAAAGLAAVGLAAAGLAAAAGGFFPIGPAAAAVPPYDPARLAHVGDARQLIVVTGVSRSSTYATLRTYQRAGDGTWSPRFAAVQARIGYAGWVPAASRIEGTGTTPAGTFTLTTAFGLSPQPGTAMGYRHADRNDYWVGDNKDPKTYNIFQPSASPHRSWRIPRAERLSDFPVQYAYALVIDFNRPVASTVAWRADRGEYVTNHPANVRRGSAIFLHVNGKGATAGCVSIPRANMISVLRWLNPAQHPRIVMAPLATIGTA
jgi:L,D-peptidoglycan transpeptidase YkuD (ErfK/YbiS/YcfS/YnhG family)